MASVCELFQVASSDPLELEPTYFPDNSTATQVLRDWDPDIRRVSRWAARSYRTRMSDELDFAQDARVRLLRCYPRRAFISDAFVRTVIGNSIRNTARAEAMSLDKTEAVEDVSVFEHVDSSSNHSDPDLFLVAGVRRFLTELPQNLQEVYDLLYVQGLPQREAAAKMGVSQPRIAELKTMLLRRGAETLASLAG